MELELQVQPDDDGGPPDTDTLLAAAVSREGGLGRFDHSGLRPSISEKELWGQLGLRNFGCGTKYEVPIRKQHTKKSLDPRS